MSLLFLDIDGVLNRHEEDRHGNGYCQLHAPCVAELNRILAKLPEVPIVVSSAWRYHVLNGSMTIAGLESLLLTHGVNCWRRIHGITEKDPLEYSASGDWQDIDRAEWESMGLMWRKQQIFDYWAEHGMGQSVVLDDLPLDLANLVKTDPSVGLTAELADEVIRRLTA